MGKFPEMQDGDKIIMSDKQGFRFIQKCCGCGLMHLWEMEIVGETIHMTVSHIDDKEIEENHTIIHGEFIRDGEKLDPETMKLA